MAMEIVSCPTKNGDFPLTMNYLVVKTVDPIEEKTLTSLGIQPYLLRKCDWSIIYYSLEGEVPSQTVFGSIGFYWDICRHIVFRNGGFTYIWMIFKANVENDSIHGAYGIHGIIMIYLYLLYIYIHIMVHDTYMVLGYDMV